MSSFVRGLSEMFLDVIETLVISASIFLVIYLFLVQPHQVNGESMLPNFQSGEYVLTDKVSYKLRDPRRGEVVVFHAPEAANCTAGTGCDFIKRILAVPGETIEVKNGHIFVNGQQLDEVYLPEDYVTAASDFTANRAVTLGPDEYMTIGDNRPHSSDSRKWGPVSKSDIVGKVFVRYWPLDVAGLVVPATY